MKILSRESFLKLPEGTIFAKGEPWFFGNLSIKGDSMYFDSGGNDFIYLDPHWVDAHDSGEAMARLDEMLATGCSYPMEDAFGRDGCFEDDAVFMVFEREDLTKLKRYIESALVLEGTSPNEDR